MGNQTLRSLLALALLALMTALPFPVIALDTSKGVGLQDRALFQERVDYTLTNQSGGDFHGQNLFNTSFSGATGKGADFTNALLDREDQRRLCQDADGVNSSGGVSTRDSLEC